MIKKTRGNRIIRLFGSLMMAVVMTACSSHDEHADHDHDHGHAHGHDHEEDMPKGPNGGRLIEAQGLTFEVKIEESATPRFRLWLTSIEGPVTQNNVQVSLVTERLLGAREQFSFVSDGSSWLATTAVNEPHSFDVILSATVGGKTISAQFESYEGRTEIAADAARGAGIVSALIDSGPIAETLSVMGSVQPAVGAEAMVTARFPGVIQTINKQTGDRVRRGEVIATVDSNLSLASYPITSPLNGVIVQRYVEVGAPVESDPIYKIVDPSKLQVELLLFGEEVRQVQAGQVVSVVPAAGGDAVDGKIVRIQPVVDRATQGASVYVALSSMPTEWVAGSAVSAEIILNDSPAQVRVPRAALQTFRDWDVVFVRQGDIFEVQPVTLGRMDSRYAEIVSGLTGGEEIVIEQSYLIKADIEKSGAVHDH
jgi:cobalt-zinc-cadmium efflux system membrane fusion protein